MSKKTLIPIGPYHPLQEEPEFFELEVEGEKVVKLHIKLGYNHRGIEKLSEGMQFDQGYLSPYFVTDAERMEVVLEDPYILIYEKKISSIKDILPLLEKIARTGKPLLIIAEEVD